MTRSKEKSSRPIDDPESPVGTAGYNEHAKTSVTKMSRSDYLCYERPDFNLDCHIIMTSIVYIIDDLSTGLQNYILTQIFYEIRVSHWKKNSWQPFMNNLLVTLINCLYFINSDTDRCITKQHRPQVMISNKWLYCAAELRQQSVTSFYMYRYI